MKITSFTTEFSTNTYFIFGENVTVVVDPGGSTADLLEILSKEGKKPDYVLVTHGHYDHTFSCAAMQRLGAKVYMSAQDDYLVRDNGHVVYLGKIIEKFDYNDVNGGDVIRLGDLEFKVTATPGHTPGGVCYLMGDYLFSGDTLFLGTIGRTDFPGGNKQDMTASLKKLSAITNDYNILPGHGMPTTLAREKITNPYLK